jgi:hypothetical protein
MFYMPGIHRLIICTIYGLVVSVDAHEAQMQWRADLFRTHTLSRFPPTAILHPMTKSTAVKDRKKRTAAPNKAAKKSGSSSSRDDLVMNDWPIEDDLFIMQKRKEGMQYKDIARELSTYAWAVRKRHTDLKAIAKRKEKALQKLKDTKTLENAK